MTTTLTHRLAVVFQALIRPRRTAPPRLENLHLSAHDLADLNLPPEYRAKLDALRLQNLGDSR